jgi:hypothetical protein
MYEFNGEQYSYEQLLSIAETKGYTIDELFNKNPEIKKLEDTTGKTTSQGQGAPVAGTVAPENQQASTESSSEDGSSVLAL